VFLLAVCFSLALAEDIKGRITKVDAKAHKVYVIVGDSKDAKEFEATKDVKVFLKKKGEKEEVKEGLEAKVFTDIPEKGRNAVITTNDAKKVTMIVVGGGGKKQ
jgi:hypothetical protein